MTKELFNTMGARRYLGEKMAVIRLKALYGDKIFASNKDKKIEKMKLDKLEIHLDKQKLADGCLRIPTSGEETLFYCRPSSETEDLPKGEYRNSNIVIEYNQDEDADEISKKLQENVNALKTCIEDINEDINDFNMRIAAVVGDALREREELEEKREKRKETFESIVLPS